MTRRKARCPVCGRTFVTSDAHKKYDTDRCSYIALYLKRPQAVRMGRDAAIEHYGALYDDPLRLVGKTRYSPQIRHIYAWCVEHGRTTFTAREIAEGFDGDIGYYKLAAIHRRHHVVHACGERETNGVGSRYETLWKFELPGCKEIMRLA